MCATSSIQPDDYSYSTLAAKTCRWGSMFRAAQDDSIDELKKSLLGRGRNGPGVGLAGGLAVMALRLCRRLGIRLCRLRDDWPVERLRCAHGSGAAEAAL